jgi:hypothetical protein
MQMASGVNDTACKQLAVSMTLHATQIRNGFNLGGDGKNGELKVSFNVSLQKDGFVVLFF